MAYTLLSGSIVAPVIMGFFWKRANAVGTLISMCVSVFVAVVSMAVWGIGSNAPIVLSVVSSFITIVVVSLTTRPTGAERISRWEHRLDGQ